MNKQDINKIQKNKFDTRVVENILEEIIENDFPKKNKINISLNQNYKEFDDYDENSPLNTLAYTQHANNYTSQIVFDIKTFVHFFGNNDNEIDKTLLRLAARYNFDYNVYIKIFDLLYHELEHAHQNYYYQKNYWEMINYERNNKAPKSSQKKQKLAKWSIITLSSFSTDENEIYMPNHDICPIEHKANVQGKYKVLKLFEKNIPSEIKNINKTYILLKELLCGYEIEKGKLISPYEKYLKIQKPYSEEYAFLCEYAKEMTEKYYKFLDSYDKLSYGFPVDKDLILYLETLKSNEKTFESTKSIKKYIKKL